jgi:hypothetical protein
MAIQNAPSAHEAFKIAERNKDKRRPDWDAVKFDVMRDILRAKAAQHEYVRRKLLATGDRMLVENSWRDDVWGWGPNRDGQNMLGKLWMEIRAELTGVPSLNAEPALAAEGAKPIIPNWFPDDRCQVCGWPLAQCRDQGCVAGDCSFRPQEGTESYRITQLRRKALAERADPAQSADTPSDDHEYACLRVVYEAARGYLRTEADFPERHAIARDRLEDAIEAVKAIDDGQYEPDADTPSEAPVAWQRRCDGGEWLQCSREQYVHTVRRGNAGVVGDNAEARALYALRQQPARDGVSEATKILAIAIAHIAHGIPDAKEVAADALSQAAALEAAARVRADHFVDANKKVGDTK